METTPEASKPGVRIHREDVFLGLDKDAVFLKLSALLTGVGDLDPVLGKAYLKKLEASYGPQIEELCKLYYDVIRDPDPIEALRAKLGTSEPIAAAARQIVKIWMLSQFDEPNAKAPTLAGHFERGLLWRIIDAHPPAFSARRHGYWTQSPHE